MLHFYVNGGLKRIQNYHARPAVQCSQQTGPADIELRGTGETQFGIRPSRILSKWINAVFFYIFFIHNDCWVIKIEKTAEFQLINYVSSF